MALKDTWKDKVDGVDDVLAKDINSIAQSAIQSEEEISKQATTINGKVDKITTPWKAYTTDANGNTVPKALAAKPADGGVVLYNAGGIVKTNAPVEDLDCVNKKTMEDGLSKKLDKVTSNGTNTRVYGINSKGEQLLINLFTKNKQGYIPIYGTKDGVSGDSDEGSVIVTGMPEKPYHAAPMKYVDGKVSELEHSMMNALGTQYITVEVKDFGASIPIPSGAMKFAYIESLGVIKGYDNDGNELGVAEVDAINVGDTEHSIDDLPKYIEIPEGIQAISLSVTPPVGTVYTQGVGGKIIFQAKVGG